VCPSLATKISTPHCVRYLFVDFDEERRVGKEGGYTRRMAVARCMLLPAQRNLNINSDEQHAIFAHKLQSALRLTLGFSNIYCEL
jgi:hypothetical protein